MSLQHLYSSVLNNFQNQVDKTFLGHVKLLFCVCWTLFCLIDMFDHVDECVTV